jgi:hypothetical protein
MECGSIDSGLSGAAGAFSARPGFAAWAVQKTRAKAGHTSNFFFFYRRRGLAPRGRAL